MIRVALLLACLLVLAACSSGSDGGQGSPATTAGTASEPGVSLDGQTLEGDSLSLDQYRGKPVFVNVWASW